MTAPPSPRILIVTPEATYLPNRMSSYSECFTAKAGGLADVSAALITELYAQGADVHVAIPDYRAIFGDCVAAFLRREQRAIRRSMPEERLHLARDRAFFHRRTIYSGQGEDNLKLALAFQREVINNIIPRVAPDLIHCNDWMTGLVPAFARRASIPCLFTIHNIHSMKSTLAYIEDRGIDAQYFWQHLYFERMPHGYEQSREANAFELLTSGVFGAHYVNTVSPNFLHEIIAGQHTFVNAALRQELANKWQTGCAVGILNAPDPGFDPATDPNIAPNYGPRDHSAGKRANKLALQKTLGLITDHRAPLFFWPSRLDPVQKGCQLLSDILYALISHYWQEKLQIIFVADGAYQHVFRELAASHGFQDRIAVHPFNEHLEHRSYAAADFVLMPSRFEPCGLPQMIGCLYGALPVVHDTGGLNDTVVQLNKERGNGFVFKHYDSNGLWWALGEAMKFHRQPAEARRRQVARIMQQSAQTFNHRVTAQQYIALYEKMLRRPLLAKQN